MTNSMDARMLQMIGLLHNKKGRAYINISISMVAGILQMIGLLHNKKRREYINITKW